MIIEVIKFSWSHNSLCQKRRESPKSMTKGVMHLLRNQEFFPSILRQNSIIISDTEKLGRIVDWKWISAKRMEILCMCTKVRDFNVRTTLLMHSFKNIWRFKYFSSWAREKNFLFKILDCKKFNYEVLADLEIDP